LPSGATWTVFASNWSIGALAEQEEPLDGRVPEELLPRLLLARTGRRQKIHAPEPRVVDPADVVRE